MTKTEERAEAPAAACHGDRVNKAAKAAWGPEAWGGVQLENDGTFDGYAYSTRFGKAGMNVDILDMSDAETCADAVIAAIAAMGTV